ncbi:hypothetical protein SCEPF1_0134000600 [Saccharomyces cerevisiae]|nr:hypothetical protein SCEPF1_0134000600 [Saccharomyces cerevisiae]GMC44141.1 unnamed protein product [Saccharomyces cerevisiae]
MVKLTSIAAGVAAIAAGASAAATTTLSQSDERVNLVELVEIAEAVFNYGDFTTMLTGIPADQVTRVITGVPWYSSRLKPAISSALSVDGIYTIAN